MPLQRLTRLGSVCVPQRVRQPLLLGRLRLRRAAAAARPPPGRPAAGHDPAVQTGLEPDRHRRLVGCDRARCTATTPTVPTRWPTAPTWSPAPWQSTAGCTHRAVAPPPQGVDHRSAVPGPGPDRPGRCGPCTAASAWSPAGGGPAWSPRATPTATRPSPNYTNNSEDDMTKDELLDALESDRGQRALRVAVVHVLRVATCPTTPACPPASSSRTHEGRQGHQGQGRPARLRANQGGLRVPPRGPGRRALR